MECFEQRVVSETLENIQDLLDYPSEYDEIDYKKAIADLKDMIEFIEQELRREEEGREEPYDR